MPKLRVDVAKTQRPCSQNSPPNIGSEIQLETGAENYRTRIVKMVLRHSWQPQLAAGVFTAGE
jgi:hypothetical protein